MKTKSGRLIMIAGIVLALASLVGLSLGPSTIVGLETDVVQDPGSEPPASIPDGSQNGTSDTGPDASPPASLPSAGGGSSSDTLGTTAMVSMVLVAALGLAMVGAGAYVSRSASHDN